MTSNTRLYDSWNRQVNYLRLSVTDQCNYHCLYCRPDNHTGNDDTRPTLSVAERVQLCEIFADVGITKIRITGGEPLLYKNLYELIHRLRSIPSIQELCLTTNGQLLSRLILPLAQAGLDRVNVSVDSLRPDRFAAITGGGDLHQCLDGIDAAQEILSEPVKINVVTFCGFNDDEILDFAKLTWQSNIHVRFIEPMPMHTKYHKLPGDPFPIAEVKKSIEQHYTLTAAPTPPEQAGPSHDYKISGSLGTIGFIGALTEPFCQSCNRVRLTADGRLRGCLFSDHEIDLITPLRQGGNWEEIKKGIQIALQKKQAHHPIREFKSNTQNRLMSQIGG